MTLQRNTGPNRGNQRAECEGGLMKKQTDLNGVKQVASALLFTDIEKTKYSPMVVQHPFTNTGIAAISADGSFQLLNLLEKPEDLNIWRQSVRQQIENAETSYQIYSLINSPYALAFLRFSEPYLSKEDFSSILADAWMMSEYANRDSNVSKEQLVSMFKQADRTKLMNEVERTQLDALADPVTVYRGVTDYNAKNIRALSWTLDYDTAAWFAHRFGEDGMVYQAKIKKEHIFALLTGRNESEVVLDPKYLEDIALDLELKQEPELTM